MNDIIITMVDVRKARMCSQGARQFFQTHDLDWQDFLDNGILASKLVETNDSMALKVVKVAQDGRK